MFHDSCYLPRSRGFLMEPKKYILLQSMLKKTAHKYFSRQLHAELTFIVVCVVGFLEILF